MALTFRYSAEEIESRLQLIDKNKNLVPYPYEYEGLPESLEDVGDGSFLTTGIATTTGDIFLNDCILPAGTYIVSLEATDLVDSLETVTNPGFSLKIKIDGEEKSTPFALDTEKTAEVYLVIPDNSTIKNLLIKPQIEKAKELEGGELQTLPTAWVPYMGTISSYVDERFNSTNTKIKVLTDSVNSTNAEIAGLTESVNERFNDANDAIAGLTESVEGLTESVNERFNDANDAIAALDPRLLPTKEEDGSTDLSSTEKYILEYVNGKWVAVKISVYSGETL